MKIDFRNGAMASVDAPPVTSGLPRSTDIVRPVQLVWFVPIDHAGELNESAVPGILDDASMMLSDFRIEKRFSKSFQSRERAFFVDPY